MQIIESLSPLGLTFLSLILFASMIGVATAFFKFNQLYLTQTISESSLQTPINIQDLKTKIDSDLFIQSINAHPKKDRHSLTLFAETESRATIVKWESGLNILEIIIAIAPLLGLLGTASGLFEIFLNTGESDSETAYNQISKGISTALVTTIAGLAVAVPMVILHSTFVRKIEVLKSNLERVGTQFLQQIS